MDFWLLDVKSLLNVNSNDVCFDYINTYFDPNRLLKKQSCFQGMKIF